MEIIDLEMIPGGPKKTCHASQFDNGRVIRFNLKENGQPYALSGTETVQAIIRKPDGSETTLDIANTSSTYVDLITEEDTCDIAGVNHCEMKITEDGEDLGSGNFDMKVEKDPYGEAGDVSVGTASGPIASFETDIKDDLIECVCEINPVQDLHGENKPYPAGGGVNIWDEEWENGDISSSTGEKISGNLVISKNYIPVNPNTTYYSTMTLRTRWYDAQKNYIGTDPTIPANNTFTVPANAAFVRFTTQTNYGTTYKNDISINNPSTDHDYHPYENVCPIEGHTEMDIIRSGVNLYDKDYSHYRRPVNYLVLDVPLKIGTTYTLKATLKGTPVLNCYVGVASKGEQYTEFSNMVPCVKVDGTTMTQAFTPTNTWTSPKLIVYDGGNVNLFNSLFENYDIQLSEGTNPEYHPAEIIWVNIPFGQTIYKARINITTGRGIITHGIMQPNIYAMYTYYANIDYARFLKNTNNKAYGNYDYHGELSNLAPCFKYTQDYNTADNIGKIYTGATSDVYWLGVKKGTTLEQARALYSGLEIYFELAEPVSIQLTPEQIETLLGQKNNVYHTANGDTAVKFYTRA